MSLLATAAWPGPGYRDKSVFILAAMHLPTQNSYIILYNVILA